MTKKIKWHDKELIEETIKNSLSQTEVLKKLDYGTSSGNFQTLLKYVKLYSISIEHFQGKKIAYQKLNTLTENNLISNQDFFINGTSRTTKAIKSRILKDNIKEHKCEECSCLPIWNNKKLVLQVDHINGDRLDNRLENLRFLCPNCHSQTLTYAGKNIERKKIVKKIFNFAIFEKDRKAPSKEIIIEKLKEIGVYNTYIFLRINKENFEALCEYYDINLDVYMRKYKISGIEKLEFQNLVLEKSLKELESVLNASSNAIKKQAKKEKLFLPTSIHKSYWAKINNKEFKQIQFEDLVLENGEYKLRKDYEIYTKENSSLLELI